MKKILFAIVPLLAMMICACSNDEEDNGKGGKGNQNINITSIKFRKADIAGAKMLALASKTSNKSNVMTRGENGNDGQNDEGRQTTYSSPTFLYKVSQDGSLVEVEYTIEVTTEGDSINEATMDLIRGKVKLSPKYIYPIGDKWLFLRRSSYVFEDEEEITDENIRLSIREWVNSQNTPDGLFFLIRLADGALFQWEDATDNILFNGEFTSAVDVYGHIELMGNDIIALNNDKKVVWLKDNGNTLDETLITAIPCEFVAPAATGTFIGTSILRGKAYLIDRDNIRDQREVGPTWYHDNGNNNPERGILISLNGNFYWEKERVISEEGDIRGIGVEFRKVLLQGDSVSIDQVAAYRSYDENGGSFQFEMMQEHPCFHSSTLSWYHDRKMFTFDPEAGTITSIPMPAHYPESRWEYYDGIAYVMDDKAQSFPEHYWVCETGKDAAVQIDIDWSAITDKREPIRPVEWKFNGGSMCFETDLDRLDGSIHLLIPVIGTDAGKAQIINNGATAGTVISTLVRLN